jgi:hypothetical protein
MVFSQIGRCLYQTKEEVAVVLAVINEVSVLNSRLELSLDVGEKQNCSN